MRASWITWIAVGALVTLQYPAVVFGKMLVEWLDEKIERTDSMTLPVETILLPDMEKRIVGLTRHRIHMEQCRCTCHYPEFPDDLSTNTSAYFVPSDSTVEHNFTHMTLNITFLPEACECKKFVLPSIEKNKFPLIKGREKEFCSSCNCDFDPSQQLEEHVWKNNQMREWIVCIVTTSFYLLFTLFMLGLMCFAGGNKHAVRLVRILKRRTKKEHKFCDCKNEEQIAMNKIVITDADEVTVGRSSSCRDSEVSGGCTDQ